MIALKRIPQPARCVSPIGFRLPSLSPVGRREREKLYPAVVARKMTVVVAAFDVLAEIDKLQRNGRRYGECADIKPLRGSYDVKIAAMTRG